MSPKGRVCVVMIPALLAAACSSPRPAASRGETSAAGPAAGASTQTVSVATGLVAKSIAEMAPTDVIVSVNGVPLTRQALEAGVAVAAQKLAKRPGMTTQALQQMRQQMARKFVPEFVNRQLLVQDARRLGIKPAPEAVEKVETEAASAAEALGMTVEELRASPLPHAAYVREMTEAVPLIATLLREKVTPKISISDEFASNTVAAIEEENKAVEKRNEEKKSLLAKMRQEIVAGADFNAMADKHTEAPRYMTTDPGYWGTFESSEFPDRNVADAVFSLKTNEVSDVLSDEEGFRIVKMVKRNPAIRNDKNEVTRRESCELAQILLLREPSLINMPPNMMKKELARQAAARLTAEYVEQLAGQARIEYPHGTNLWVNLRRANVPTKKSGRPARLTPRIDGLLPSAPGGAPAKPQEPQP